MVVADQLQPLLDETDALDPFQLGSRPCHGMETPLVALLDDLLREANRGKMSLLILLDISATFDTVNHSILLGRLSELAIGGLALAWFWSFLESCPPESPAWGKYIGPSIVGFHRVRSSPQCCLTSI